VTIAALGGRHLVRIHTNRATTTTVPTTSTSEPPSDVTWAIGALLK
jgi:hypothetical protein